MYLVYSYTLLSGGSEISVYRNFNEFVKRYYLKISLPRPRFSRTSFPEWNFYKATVSKYFYYSDTAHYIKISVEVSVLFLRKSDYLFFRDRSKRLISQTCRRAGALWLWHILQHFYQ